MSGLARRRFDAVRPSLGSHRRSFVICTLDHATGRLEPLTPRDRQFIECVRRNVRRKRLRRVAEYAVWCAVCAGLGLGSHWVGW